MKEKQTDRQTDRQTATELQTWQIVGVRQTQDLNSLNSKTENDVRE